MDNRITNNITISSTPYRTGNVTNLDASTLEWLEKQDPTTIESPFGGDWDDGTPIFDIEELAQKLESHDFSDEDEKVASSIREEIRAIVAKFRKEGIDNVAFDELDIEQ